MEYPKNDRTVKNAPPPLDWNAIRERALFYVRRRGLPETMVDTIAPGPNGEIRLIQFAADTGESLDWLVTGKRHHWEAVNRMDTTINDLRALVWTLDRLATEPCIDAEGKANDEHALRILTWQAWKLLEAHDKAEREAQEVAA